jgi:hypothetical protein
MSPFISQPYLIVGPPHVSWLLGILVFPEAKTMGDGPLTRKYTHGQNICQVEQMF